MQKNIISTIHTDIRTARVTRRGATTRPEDAVRGLCKEYRRMQQVALPEASLPHMSLSEALRTRTSQKRASTKELITLEQMSALLATIQAKKEEGVSRTYPSGGALYPIETYLVGSFGNYTSVVCHYHPKKHVLEALWGMPEQTSLADMFSSSTGEDTTPSLALIFSAVWERSACKYGDFAYNLALLEAGHMAQNIALGATALGLGARPIGGFNDSVVHQILDIDGESEQAVYTILLT